MDDHQTTHWSEGLGATIFSINTRTTFTTKKSPFQLVFGQEPRSDSHHWRAVQDAAIAGDLEFDDLLLDSVPMQLLASNKRKNQSTSLSHLCRSIKSTDRRFECET